MIDTMSLGLVLPSTSSVDFGQRRIEKGKIQNLKWGPWIEDFQTVPRFTFLTHSYVEWCGLEIIPIQKRRNQGIAYIGDGGILPPPGESSHFCEGVRFEGFLYEREPDGLCFTLV